MTRRSIGRLLLAIVLVGIGWTVARAQAPLPDFELVVDAPEGETTVDCVRGCQGLAWTERMVPGTVPPATRTVFSYACRNAANARCGSGRIGGWLMR